MRNPGQPTITVAETITARPLRDDDADWIVAAFEDPEIRRWHSRQLTVDEALTWIHESASRWN